MDATGRFLIQMSGPPGSGKSTLARLLARSINGVVINHDLIKAFFLESNFSFQDSSKLTYQLDWTLAEDMIQQGRSVIVDSVSNYEEVVNRGTALAEKYGYTYRYVECRLENLDQLDRRLHERIPLRSQRAGVYEPPAGAPGNDTGGSVGAAALFRKWMNPQRPEDATAIIIVDSTRRPEECLETIMERLSSPPSEQIQDGVLKIITRLLS
ncbi:P-loop containing nucleoside triphosphate hydrolase protein [Xylaria flabelliformis]|nr:P-loop containing nucleoside triphosphate hydrolase protein [Xylaria flabelliformis]